VKTLEPLIAAVVVAAFCATPRAGFAADKKAKLKPYTLRICIVSGDKLGEMGDPYVYEYNGREIRFCCKSCVKDFKQDTAKYIKKIEEEEAKAKKAKS